MGGAEHVVCNLADELVKLGHEVKIAYLTGEVLVSPNSADVDLIPIGMKGSKDFAKAYSKLRGLVKSFKPDVVHSHMFHSNIISRLLRLTTNIPKVISTAHSSNEGGKARMLAYRLTDHLTDISTNVSKDAVDTYVLNRAVRYDKMIPILNGIDTNKFSYSSKDRKEQRERLNIVNNKMILCVGRLDKPKDYPNLLNSIVMLKNIRNDFKVFIVGDGPLKEELNDMVIELGIKDYVSFLGIRRDVKALMSATDIYVMSSAWEGLPMVILEAMSCERLVVATNCGGISDALSSAGIIVDVKNNVQLFTKLNEALNMSPEKRLDFGSAARQRVIDNYSLDINVSSYLKIYEDESS